MRRWKQGLVEEGEKERRREGEKERRREEEKEEKEEDDTVKIEWYMRR
jgi:hypothetical protein